MTIGLQYRDSTPAFRGLVPCLGVAPHPPVPSHRRHAAAACRAEPRALTSDPIHCPQRLLTVLGQPLVREVAWTEVMDAEDVAPMEEEAAAGAADEWQAVDGFWLATKVQGASAVDGNLVPYRLQIPVDHHPLLQAGNEVRFQAPGADHSKVYVLPAGPFAEGKAFTFTVLLHPQAAMGDVSVTHEVVQLEPNSEVRACHEPVGCARPAARDAP